MENTPDTEAMRKDKDSKAKMKAYANQKRQVKPHNLNAGDITLVKQRRLNKASPHFEPVPYTILDVKGSMITARRATVVSSFCCLPCLCFSHYDLISLFNYCL